MKFFIFQNFMYHETHIFMFGLKIEKLILFKCGSRGGGGTGGPDPPPGKSQVKWVSIGNKQLDPPPPLEKVGRPLENVGPPLEP